MAEVELLQYYKKMCERNIVLDFQGAVSQEILVGLAELIKNKFFRELGRSYVVKKIFSIFIEMAQNIALYSAERVHLDSHPTDTGAGIIVVTDKDKTYTITSGNLVDNKDIPEITRHCDTINKMDQEELKQFYKRQIKASRKKGKKGAGLGMIDIARKSGNPISYEVSPINKNTSFFVISVKIEEEKENGKPEN